MEGKIMAYTAAEEDQKIDLSSRLAFIRLHLDVTSQISAREDDCRV